MTKVEIIEALKVEKIWYKSEVVSYLEMALELREWYLVECIAYRIRMMFGRDEENPAIPEYDMGEYCNVATSWEQAVWYE